jgi:hypothetical protein
MTSQYGAYALRAGLVRIYTRMRTYTPTRPGTHMHARTNAQACARRPICNTYCFSTAMISWTRLSVTLYVQCLSCLWCNVKSWWQWELLRFSYVLLLWLTSAAPGDVGRRCDEDKVHDIPGKLTVQSGDETRIPFVCQLQYRETTVVDVLCYSSSTFVGRKTAVLILSHSVLLCNRLLNISISCGKPTAV